MKVTLFLLALLGLALTERRTHVGENDPELFPLNTYNRYAWILNWLQASDRNCGARCSLYHMKNSHEGRPIDMIKITGDGTATKSVFVDAGIHGSEMMSVAVALNMIDTFIRDYRTNSEVKSAVDKFDWYIMPLVNPDAYEFGLFIDTRFKGLWGKNMRVFGSCTGVDLNRNFDFHWTGPGSSTDPCSGEYRGPSAGSEVETQNVKDAINAISRNITGYFSMHTYGQLILHPWFYSRSANLPNKAEQVRVAQAASARMRQRYGTNYVVGSAPEILYEVSGSSVDWALNAGATYSYALELSSRGTYRNNISESFIGPISAEVIEGFLTFATEMRR